MWRNRRACSTPIAQANLCLLGTRWVPMSAFPRRCTTRNGNTWMHGRTDRWTRIQRIDSLIATPITQLCWTGVAGRRAATPLELRRQTGFKTALAGERSSGATTQGTTQRTRAASGPVQAHAATRGEQSITVNITLAFPSSWPSSKLMCQRKCNIVRTNVCA